MVTKAVKVRRPGEGRKFGVAAKSLAELLPKACALLQLPSSKARLCLYEDGTEVTETYFRKIPDNSELILLAPGEDWQGYVSEIQRFLDAFSSQTDGIVRAAQGLLSGEEAPKRRKLLADLIHNLSQNIEAESREDDEKWFQGVESRFKTKSGYMRYSCESRIRSYMKEVGAYASSLPPSVHAKFRQIAKAMLEKLKSERYNGFYFDRRAEKKACLCTPEGWFSCQGPFDTKDCPCRHSINPYGNKESRILFSTWNLDHVIEKKRTILPTLAEALADRRDVDWEYFYRLLFTVSNLKLVHIACHKKTNHNLSCDKRKIFRKSKPFCRVQKRPSPAAKTPQI
ncbi:DNA fragmentation factor subunit beta isoform X3 [Anolis carolinensis]|uniref:DNA fragmentation factor subunit beta n=1 Tax=Anolis carolinensis TaxID=28377 RepID=H9GDK6_ANOCA|nr:PREDICTED: DNA fragmentation factor subunit beta isoform X2 [Anolis carolinensis]